MMEDEINKKNSISWMNSNKKITIKRIQIKSLWKTNWKVAIKCCKVRHGNQGREKRREEKKRKSTASKPAGIQVHTPPRKVGSAVKNWKTPRKIVFLYCEPLQTPFKDVSVTYLLVSFMNTPTIFFNIFFN